jgi:hypothetical protein
LPLFAGGREVRGARPQEAAVNLIALEMHQRHARPLEPDLYARCRSEVLKDRRRTDVNLSGNLYKLWNRPGDVLPIVPKEI